MPLTFHSPMPSDADRLRAEMVALLRRHATGYDHPESQDFADGLRAAADLLECHGISDSAPKPKTLWQVFAEESREHQ